MGPATMGQKVPLAPEPLWVVPQQMAVPSTSFIEKCRYMLYDAGTERAWPLVGYSGQGGTKSDLELVAPCGGTTTVTIGG